MTITTQILFGSLLWILCSFIHVILLVQAIRTLKLVGLQLKSWFKNEILVLITFIMILASHTAQVWLWAYAFILLGVFTNIPEAIYFSLVTYTTLGYGEVILNEGLRVFGAMAAVTGLLNFGLSTAFLVGIFSKLFEKQT